MGKGVWARTCPCNGEFAWHECLCVSRCVQTLRDSPLPVNMGASRLQPRPFQVKTLLTGCDTQTQTPGDTCWHTDRHIMDRGHDEASAQKRQGSEFASKPLRGFTVSKAGLQRKKPGKKHFPSHPLLFTKPQSENTADHRNNAADYILTHTGLAADANMHAHTHWLHPLLPSLFIPGIGYTVKPTLIGDQIFFGIWR